MNLINTILGTPLGYLMYLCYAITRSYGMAIILFTLISKIVLFPLSISVQKNSIRMVKLQPKLNEIKSRYAGDKDRIAEEQIKLYDGEKYSPAMGCLPTLIQIPLILGLINVIYNPLKHLLHLGADTVSTLIGKSAEILGMESLGIGGQLLAIDAIQNPAYAGIFESLNIIDPDSIFIQIRQLDLSFLGLNLGMTPSLIAPSALIWIPLISGISCFAMCLIQNRINVLQREQGIVSQWGMTIFLVAFSIYFPFIVPAGVGVYWIASNIFSIAVMFLVNIIINPKKHIDYASRPQKSVLSNEEKAEQRQIKKANRLREKADSKRFYDKENKQLVFYSAKSGFYKYFKNVIDYIIENSEITIHYVTSDPDDAVFQQGNPQIVPYYIGDKALITFMMKMDADMVVMTMPDLQRYHIKRSLVRKDVEYVYMWHGVASTHLALRKGALDHYDTIFCTSPFQIEEIQKTEQLYNLPKKQLIACGYGLIENLSINYASIDIKNNDMSQILIAPSWQADNIMESCIESVLNQLIGLNYRVILRPHPEYIKRFPEKISQFMDKFKNKQSDRFIIQLDFSSNTTVYESDIIISDWSSIASEFSFSTGKPTLYINTPMKIMNPDYEELGITPFEIYSRNILGKSIDMDQIHTVKDAVNNLLYNMDEYHRSILRFRDESIYHVGSSGKIGGEYIIQALAKKLDARRGQDDGQYKIL